MCDQILTIRLTRQNPSINHKKISNTVNMLGITTERRCKDMARLTSVLASILLSTECIHESPKTTVANLNLGRPNEKASTHQRFHHMSEDRCRQRWLGPSRNGPVPLTQTGCRDSLTKGGNVGARENTACRLSLLLITILCIYRKD